jgi:hypothetical protein
MSGREGVADYREALEILSSLARKGDVRAAIALASHMRKELPRQGAQAESIVDELSRRKHARQAERA